MSSRIPTAAGTFYPSTPNELIRTLDKVFKEHSFGPQSLPDKTKQTNLVKGAIIPHAGIDYSGMCAAHTYKKIKESDNYDLFIILGFNHRGIEYGDICTTNKDWMTPLGHAKIDYDFIERLTNNSNVILNNSVFEDEHSIEVQLPFLQYLYKNEFRFVPISIPSGTDHKSFGRALKKNIDESGKKVCIIASSDFTHYGDNFGYVPFRDHILEKIKALDFKAIEHIKVLDSNGFLGYIRENDATICGKDAIALLIETLSSSVNRIEIVSYYTSGELMGNHDHSVSYAGIIFEKVGF